MTENLATHLVERKQLYSSDWDINGYRLSVYRVFDSIKDRAMVYTASSINTVDYINWLATFIPVNTLEHSAHVVKFNKTYCLVFSTMGMDDYVFTGWDRGTTPCLM